MRQARYISGNIGIYSGRIPLISLVQLIAVADHLNFRHAANALGVTQSSVSTRIKALEDTLGIVLFERRHRGVRLTEAGHHFVVEVAAGIEQLDHAIQTAGATANGRIGRLSIGLHSSIASGFLAELRHRYRIEHPAIEQVVIEGPSSQTIAMVRDGRLDMAFVLNIGNVSDCHSRHLWSEAFMIALPSGHRLATVEAVTWADLAAESFLIRQGGAGPQVFEHVVRRVAERGRSPSIQRREIGRDTLMHMIAAGEGITLTSEAATPVPFPGVVFRQIADETEQARFSAVWSPHNRSPALKNLLDLATHMSRSGLDHSGETHATFVPSEGEERPGIG